MKINIFWGELTYVSAKKEALVAGPLAVKALVWVAVEEVHARGWSFAYEGPVNIFFDNKNT